MTTQRRYWFAHWAGKPKSLWPVSWQGFAIWMFLVGVVIGGGASYPRIIVNVTGWPFWQALALDAVVSAVLIALFYILAARTCDPARTAEDYRDEERARNRARNERLQRRVDAARESVQARRNITE